MISAFFKALDRVSLVKQIVVALIIGLLVAGMNPEWGHSVAFLGDLFVKALKSIAPILVLVLVISAIAQHKIEEKTNIKAILSLYLIGTFLAALTAVVASFAWPTTLILMGDAANIAASPQDITTVLKTLLMNMVDNPFSAVMNANYLGILTWAILLGISFRHASATTKTTLIEVSNAFSFVVKCVIKMAPIGIFGLVAGTFAAKGFEAFITYLHLLAVLIGCMLFVALVVNPLIVYWKIRKNPFPLVFTCLRESGITAFFMRSSAANIPVNINLCKKLGLHEDTYSISIPLGATINMAGAAVTITVMSLAAVHTLGIPVSMTQALLLSVLASVSACGASGVAGGSLLLIPLACSLFGIDNDIAAQIIGIGLLIGVIQDSAETALNSSTDVLFTATAEIAADNKIK